MPRVRLSDEERQKIIDDFDNGIENPEYMVVKTRQGIQVRKRRNAKKVKKEEADPPVHSEPVEEVQEAKPKTKKDKSWMDDITFYNIQMMNSNLKELNDRLDKYKEKQKKMKGKYKKLKKYVTEDSEEELEQVTIPVEQKEEPVVQQVDQVVQEVQEECQKVVQEEAQEEEPPPPVQYTRVRRGIDFSRYMR